MRVLVQPRGCLGMAVSEECVSGFGAAAGRWMPASSGARCDCRNHQHAKVKAQIGIRSLWIRPESEKPLLWLLLQSRLLFTWYSSY